MDEHQCTSCGASLPRTGTFCLACNTPVPEAVRGLSVGDTQVVRRGRPAVAAVVTAAVVLVVGALAYGTTTLYHHHLDKGPSTAAQKTVDILVRAEAGHPAACPYLPTYVSGDAQTEQAACIALVGDDKGAELRHVQATVHRHGRSGTVDVRGTLVDHAGKRPFDRTLTVVEQDGTWLVAWDQKPLAAA